MKNLMFIPHFARAVYEYSNVPEIGQLLIYIVYDGSSRLYGYGIINGKTVGSKPDNSGVKYFGLIASSDIDISKLTVTIPNWNNTLSVSLGDISIFSNKDELSGYTYIILNNSDFNSFDAEFVITYDGEEVFRGKFSS